MTYRDTKMDLEKIQSTMRPMSLDDMSRRNETCRGIAGRESAMAVKSARDTSHTICFNLGEGALKGRPPCIC